MVVRALSGSLGGLPKGATGLMRRYDLLRETRIRETSRLSKSMSKQQFDKRKDISSNLSKITFESGFLVPSTSSSSGRS